MEKYVERCIRSVLVQDFSDFEVLVIDDGSIDSSSIVIRLLAGEDSRVKFYEFPNGGVSVARNRGLDIAQGKYIMFIDADDYIDEGYLARIFSKVSLNQADIYIWGITKNHSNGQQTFISPTLSGIYNKKEYLESFVIEQYKTHKGLYGYISNKLIRNEIISSQGLRFDESMSLMEDYDFFLRYYACCDSFYCLDEIGYHYVASPSNSTKKKRVTNYLQLIDTHERCKTLLEENGALTKSNEELLKNALGGLSLSAFLEMKDYSIIKIDSLLNQIHSRKYTIDSLRLLKTNKKNLKEWILKRSAYTIYVYLIIWNCYLKMKTEK